MTTNIGENIRNRRTELRLSQKKVADYLGITQQAYSKYENNLNSFNFETALKLGEILDISLDELGLDYRTEKPLGNLQVLPNDKVYMIPVFESVSAGFGAYACSDIKEYFPMYIDNPADAPDMLCLTVQGDSMYPKIEEGDMVAVRKQSSVDSGSVAVLLIDGEEGVVKKVNYGSDWIELISFNPMYPPRRFEGAEVQRLQVVGLVKKVIKNM